jgi:tetratricopeptide (TPR) repeat protein
VWDDNAHITSPALQSLAGLRRIWFDLGATQQYYPVTHTAFWVMHRLWGDATLGYHLVNIALHVTSAWLLAVILTRLGVRGALVAAAIFALHPVQVDSVAWMTELKNTLSGVCYFGAALAYLHFDTDRRPRAYVTALVLFLVALFAKSVTAMLPAGLLVVFWWQRGRWDWKRDIVPLVPFFVVGAAAGLFTSWVERTYIGAEGLAFQYSLVERALIAGRAFVFYLWTLAVPLNLAFIYPKWGISARDPFQYAYPIGVALTFVLAWRWRARSRAPLAALAFFAVTIFPALGFLAVYPFRYSLVANHFQYLACAGPIALAAAGVAHVGAVGSSRRIEALASLAIGAVLGVGTWRLAGEFKDSDALYLATLARNPDCFLCSNNLGFELMNEPNADLPGAIAYFQEAIRANPDYFEPHANLGTAAVKLGRPDEAIREFQVVLQKDPDNTAGLNNLGKVLLDTGRAGDALPYLQRAIALKPDFALAHSTLAFTLFTLGRVDEAMAEWRECLRLAPDLADARSNFAIALAQTGRVPEAYEQIARAAAIDPANPTIRQNLGRLALQLQKYPEAVDAYRAVLAHLPPPGTPEAHNDLAVALASAGRFAEAAAEFAEVVRLRPDFPNAQANLARALAAAKGR